MDGEGMLAEAATYLETLESLRGQIAKLVVAAPVAALNWRPLEAGDEHVTNSLAVLAAHVAGAEHNWIYEVVGQGPVTRDRPSEFVTVADDAAELLAKLATVGEETRQVLAGLTAETINSHLTVRGHSRAVRWCILHVIEHTALHLGHMEMTYQLWQRRMIGGMA